MQFDSLKISKSLLKGVREKGFVEMTPIQEEMIPKAMGGKDIIGIAPTGTGKTAAFLLPLMDRLKYGLKSKHVRALILLPTKELAIQVQEQASEINQYCDFKIQVVYGGVGISKQTEPLQEGCDILIGTPGRVFDIYKTQVVDFKKLEVLVLDECDRMMDMGFKHQLYQMLEIIPTKRQNFLLSATFPPVVETITEDFLEFPVKIEVAPQSTIADTITHYKYDIPDLRSKVKFLAYLIDTQQLGKTLVFVRKKESATQIAKYIERKLGNIVRVIHSNKGQYSRINAIQDFKSDEVQILISTDVSARGIDVPDITHVVNFEFPKKIEDYVHRVGRTGRAGKSGIAINFCNKIERIYLEDLINDKKIGQVTSLTLPAEFSLEKMDKTEILAIEREIDELKQKRNPDYKGAFHKKKTRAEKAQFKKEKQAKQKYRGALKKR